MVSGFELRALHLLGKCFTLFALVYFPERVWHFCLGLALDLHPPTCSSYLAGITDIATKQGSKTDPLKPGAKVQMIKGKIT
jgi:hypothetical protein